MSKRSGKKPPAATRLEEFVRRHEILPVELARASGCSRGGLVRMRFGRAEATRRQMAAVLAGACLILPDIRIAITDLFSFDDGPLPAAKQDWQRVIASGRPRKRDTARRDDEV